MGRRRNLSAVLTPSLIVVALISGLMLFLLLPASFGSEWDTIAPWYINYIPWVLGIASVFSTLERVNGKAEIMLTSIIAGALMAMIFRQMNIQGIIIDEFITASLPITEFMFGTVFVFALVGVVAAFIGDRRR